ncbi:hypothetical protein B0H13DRAFT_1861618 [Mycena leptocephala]|nr:hypothetical protein B0H13DRAFT_1861618 [Mycena leptocephala]
MDAENPPIIREETGDWVADTVVGTEDPAVRVVSDSEALLNDALCPLALLSPLTEETGDADAVSGCVADVVMEDVVVVEKEPVLDAVSKEETVDCVADIVVGDEEPVGVVPDSEAPLNDTLRPVALLPLSRAEPGGTDAVVGDKNPLLEATPDSEALLNDPAGDFVAPVELLPLIWEGAPGTAVLGIDWEGLLDCALCGPVTPLEPLIMLLPLIREETLDSLTDTFGSEKTPGLNAVAD